MADAIKKLIEKLERKLERQQDAADQTRAEIEALKGGGKK